jgi:hypothetical protein
MSPVCSVTYVGGRTLRTEYAAAASFDDAARRT